MKKKRCRDCGHLSELPDSPRQRTHFCYVSKHPVPPGYRCSRFENKVLWYKRAFLFIVNMFKAVYYFFKLTGRVLGEIIYRR